MCTYVCMCMSVYTPTQAAQDLTDLQGYLRLLFIGTEQRNHCDICIDSVVKQCAVENLYQCAQRA